MIITNKVTMDLKQLSWVAAIAAVQDDRYSRNLEITLLSGGETWEIPADAAVVIRYSKPDGMGGVYDTLPDGASAWSANGNILTVALAPQVLTTPGVVNLAVTMIREQQQISTFTILIHVTPKVGSQIAESESYFHVPGFLPAPVNAKAGQFFKAASVNALGHVTAMEAVSGTLPVAYTENAGIGQQQNPAQPEHEIWDKWDARLAFGMDTSKAPVPFQVGGQLLADGTIIAHNNGTQAKNRWGYHVYEAYSKDNHARMTMLLDKHTSEAGGKPSLEFYYYTGDNHHAVSYGNTKIGSDVAFHSFCFDRDKLTAYGEIDNRMPITLARISLSKDLNTAYDTVAAADAAYEPEAYPEENNRCLKFIALKHAENGAMFYDTDRNALVCKIAGQWCDLPFTVISDTSYDIFGAPSAISVEWANGVIDGNGYVIANTGRLYTPDVIPANASRITAKDGYEFCVIPYSDAGLPSAPIPYYNPTTHQLEGSAVYYTSVDLTSISISGYPRYKLIARRTDLAAIDPTEGANIVIT